MKTFNDYSDELILKCKKMWPYLSDQRCKNLVENNFQELILNEKYNSSPSEKDHGYDAICNETGKTIEYKYYLRGGNIRITNIPIDIFDKGIEIATEWILKNTFKAEEIRIIPKDGKLYKFNHSDLNVKTIIEFVTMSNGKNKTIY